MSAPALVLPGALPSRHRPNVRAGGASPPAAGDREAAEQRDHSDQADPLRIDARPSLRAADLTGGARRGAVALGRRGAADGLHERIGREPVAR
jgi:hypothetical protein